MDFGKMIHGATGEIPIEEIQGWIGAATERELMKLRADLQERRRKRLTGSGCGTLEAAQPGHEAFVLDALQFEIKERLA